MKRPKKSRRPTPGQPHTGIFARLFTVGKVIWAVVAGLVTLSGYLVLRPSLSIEPYSSQNPRIPFAEQFYIQNNSLYKIKQVQPRCAIASVRNGILHMRNFSLMNPMEFVGELASGAKTNVTCPLDRVFGDPSAGYGELRITIWFPYKLPLGISACKATSFNGKPVSDGSYIWTYAGSPDCDTLDNPK